MRFPEAACKRRGFFGAIWAPSSECRATPSHLKKNKLTPAPLKNSQGAPALTGKPSRTLKGYQLKSLLYHVGRVVVMRLSTRGRQRATGGKRLGAFWFVSKTERDTDLKYSWMNVLKEKNVNFLKHERLIVDFFFGISNKLNVLKMCSRLLWDQWGFLQTEEDACSGVCVRSSLSVSSLHKAIFCHLRSGFLLHDFCPHCLGGSWMYLVPFMKCCTVLSTYTSFSLWFALLIFAP